MDDDMTLGEVHHNATLPPPHWVRVAATKALLSAARDIMDAGGTYLRLEPSISRCCRIDSSVLGSKFILHEYDVMREVIYEQAETLESARVDEYRGLWFFISRSVTLSWPKPEKASK